ncbi:signal peptidase I [Sporosarcina sp. PTS2304]|uniref:S26 family signal peptidase n=1 Tax=Sporosarcina sp. PTS2304 TaxID=2283194 RepID=UPI000E0CE2BB|nr:S26 family signal peptidase [Sporosarcina sp. PTS2304]AXH99741.1 signal peptidase I [Sporosarcina sp. PTS2304]
MNDFKQKLDQMMGDTSEQERRIRQRVHEELQPARKKQSWRVLFVTASLPVVALVLLLTFIPSNLLSSDEGRGVPYDPLDDLAKISALQKKQQLSTIDYEELSQLPRFDQVDGLRYVDKDSFTIDGSTEKFHTVMERKSNLFDDIVYKAGDVVRTMTNTTSHLPTYNDVYYEVFAVPGDRVVLKNGELKINGKPLPSDMLERYKKQGIIIAGGYDQLLNAREYLLLNHFPASDSIQGATITPVHKIYGQLVGIASEKQTKSIYLDYLSGQLTGDYTPEQLFDLYLYDDLLGMQTLPQTAAFTKINRKSQLFLEASYRKLTVLSDNRVEMRYQYGREGIAEYVYVMEWHKSERRWVVEE